jgi:hypothetical protein
MRNTLAFLATAVLVVAGLGWYLDWYKIGTTPGQGGHREVTIDINAKKVRADVKKGAEAGAEEVQQVLKKDGEPSTSEPGKAITIQPRSTIRPGESNPPHDQ